LIKVINHVYTAKSGEIFGEDRKPLD